MQPAVTWEPDSRHPHAASVVGHLTKRAARVVEPTSAVVILVFAHPDSWSARQLLQRHEYFDIRSGDDWDVFFPGYYRWGSMGDPTSIDLGDYWAFSPRSFASFQRDLERRTDYRWRCDGESELVAMNAVLTSGAATVDFASVVSGPLTEPDLAVATRTLAQAIERLSQQLEDHGEDANYGLTELLGPSSTTHKEGAIGRIGIGAAGGVAAALIRHALGLP